MTMQGQISEHMPIKLADGQDHGQVDRVDEDYLKLTKDETGQHLWVPMSAVDHVDQHVHLKLSHDELHQQALTEDPHPEHQGQ